MGAVRTWRDDYVLRFTNFSFELLQALAKVALFVLLVSVSIDADSQTPTTVAGYTPGNFRVTAAGAAEYTIPIHVPPGIAGMEPRLAFVFDSQRGNGLLGLGWALAGLSAIQRCSTTIVQDTFTSGVNFDSYDRYCVDGQRLVAVAGAYGADGTEYRTERESFTKVFSNVSGGSIWFKAWTRAGQVFEYGNTADSRIEAQGLTVGRVWALNKVSDAAGNYLTILYEEEPAPNNVDYRPQRIDYTGNPNALPLVSPFASVRFTYDGRDDATPAYVAGSMIKTMKRLVNVKTYVGENPVTDYRLTYNYSPNNGPSRVIAITECNGAGTKCFNPISLAWEDPSGGGFTSSSRPQASPSVPGDVNGDGVTDCAWMTTDGIVHVSYTCDLTNPVTVGSLPPTAAFIVGDFDGNGRADILADNGTIWLSTASGFTQTTWSGTQLGAVGDYNGDGRADIAYESAGTLYVRYSTGSGFGAPVTVGPVVPPLMFGDFDGNGRADILDSTGAIWLSTPSGFSQKTWANSGTGQVIVGDFNGDGRADITYQSPAGSGMWVVAFSNGNGFDSPASFGSGLGCGCASGDFNGDGRDDLLFAKTALWTLAPATPDRVTTITTSLGATIGLTYKPLTDATVYTKDNDAAWPFLNPKQPMYVVSRALTSDGIGGNRTTDNFYRGAKTHMTGGGFLGFRQVEVTEVSNSSLKSITTFDQAYPYQGLTTQLLRKQSNNTVVQQIDNTWTKTALTPAAGSGGLYHKIELSQAVEKNYELDGSLVTTVTTTLSNYDTYGNAQTVNVSTGDGYSRAAANTFSNDSANWILGRLTGSSVTSTKPSGTPPLSLTRTLAYSYQSGTGRLTKEAIEPGDSNLCLVTTHGYGDVFGNQTSSTTRNCDGSAGEAAAPAPTADAYFLARTTTTSFAATTANPVPGQFATSSTNALTQPETREFDARFGTVTKRTVDPGGPNPLVTNWLYDDFGRKSSESGAGIVTTSDYQLCVTCPPNGKYFLTLTTTGRPAVTKYFDALNREIRSENPSFDDTLARTDTEYDSLGHVRRVSRPYLATAAPKWTCYGYDPLHRMTSEAQPTDLNDNSNCDSPALTTTAYNGLTVTETNALGQTETRIKNTQGQLVQVTRQ